MATKSLIFRNGQTVDPPSEAVTSLEKRFTEHAKHNITRRLTDVTLDDSQASFMPRRKSYATVKSCQFVMYANYFHLQVASNAKNILMYTISGLETVSRRKRGAFVTKLLEDPIFQGRLVATDFTKTILTLQKLPLPSRQYVVKVDLLKLPEPRPSDPLELVGARLRNRKNLMVKYECEVSLTDYQCHLNDPSKDFRLSDEAIRCLNIIIGSYPVSRGLTSLGARYFPQPNQPRILPGGQSNKDFADIGSGLLAQRGYFASVRPSIGRLLVNVNTTSGAFYDPRAPSLLALFTKWAGGSPLSKGYGAARAFLRNLRVETQYGDGPKIRTIVDYHPAKKNAAQVTFEHNGAVCSVQKYFEQAYGIRLKCPQAAVVNVGSTTAPVWLPMELARVLPNQKGRTMLTAEQMTNMLEFAKRTPSENADLITTNGLHVLGFDGESLRDWGLTPSLAMVTVHARLLKSPQLKYGKKTIRIAKPGSWNLKDVPEFIAPPPLKDITWGFVRLIMKADNPTPAHVLDAAKRDFESTLKKYKINVASPVGTPQESLEKPGTHFEESAKEAVDNAIQKAKAKKLTWVLVLLPNLKGTKIYDQLKKLADVDYGVTTICCLEENFVSKGVQYYANVALKVNQKLGGMNHTMERSEALKPLDKSTMVIGIDVTHPGPGSSPHAPSIAAVVASEDGRFASWPGRLRIQERRKEMVGVQNLTTCLAELLQNWKRKNNGRLPSKLVIFRDGVSEGQFQLVLDEEVAAIKATFPLAGYEKHPKLSVIVVTKRIHSRFYPTKLADANPKNGNPIAGTVIDRGVTSLHLQDFFLYAHDGLIGTSRPARYSVIMDELSLGPDDLQTMVYNLCHLYAKATRSVSLCPPAKYADMLCERGRSYLHSLLKEQHEGSDSQDHVDINKIWNGTIHPNLKNTMFYL